MRLSLLLTVLLMLTTSYPLPDEFQMDEATIIVNVKTNQLALIESGHIAEVHPVATGKKGDETPDGLFTVVVKAEQPYYRKKDIAGGDPKNPLGTRWIGFDANGTDGRTFGLHGTNRPGSIGYSASAGCIRLANATVERLYDRVDIGSKVLVVNSEKSFKTLGLEAGFLEEHSLGEE
ncbi:L,D-transpeptidase [Shouchella shacheensis]|uniref:L,D-transpeptidase n=1 Tax=Shouchella shacheensis TaxID=1649580 RepID=UPI00073FB67E|nr:L,D-transpeptidase [Shouchella shacheensis]